MKKVLVTGASGMLGGDIIRHIQRNGCFDIYGIGRKDIETTYPYYKIDLSCTNELKDLLRMINPDVIVHCAANVNLKDCEINKENADRLHVTTTQVLSSFKIGTCKMLYVSTDSIFDGEKGNYKETDEPAPLNYYAITKLRGEQSVASINPNSLILRTNIYGFHRSFLANSLFEWAYTNLAEKKYITGFSDVYFNPLYTGQLSELIIQLLCKNINGLLHAGCKEKLSKYDFVLKIAETFGFKKSLIRSGVSDEMLSNIKRPKNTTLNVDLLNNKIQKKYSFKEGIENLKKDFSDYKKESE